MKRVGWAKLSRNESKSHDHNTVSKQRSKSTSNGLEVEEEPLDIVDNKKRKMSVMQLKNPAYAMGAFADENNAPQAHGTHHLQFDQWKGIH